MTQLQPRHWSSHAVFELEQAQLEIVCRLSMAAEYRNEEIGNHVHRMSMFCRVLAEAAGFSQIDPAMLESVMLQLAHWIALTHHEKWDGSGYPMGLRGEQIPIAGRIACICDVFDALISKRPYKPAWSVERAFQEIQNCSGKDFDPDLSMAMVKMESEIREIIDAFGRDRTHLKGVTLKAPPSIYRPGCHELYRQDHL